ncbi:hypothetical protein AB6A40_001565 [Gnathostoma spinigerum]|uniref:Microtubule-associated protein 1A/B/S-like MBL-like domain-containing protein n=1 Tax=Gnathostoma spinigerum TaxID=75299 RepID=A0ABD6E5R0_9BILA
MTTGDNLVELLPAVKTVSFIRAKQPAIYVFAGGNEDAALFSVNDFSLLIDGGDEKVVPYWNLIRNYEKVSALIATRPSPESLRGIATMLQRKAVEQCSPHIGAVIANLPPESAVTGDSDVAQLIKAFYDGLLREGLKLTEAQAGTKLEPITLYEVIGEGSLRMIIMNPEKGSKELLALSAAVKNGGNVEKISAAASTAFLLVWSPADPTKKTVRILYPGACPLEKLYASLEKLKVEECLRYPEYILADKAKYVVQKSANRSRPFSARVSSKNANPPTVSSGVTKTPARPATRPSAVTHTRAPADLPRTPATTNKTMPSTKPIAKKPISRTTATTRVSHTSTAVRRVPSPTKTSPGQTSPIRKPNSPTKAAGPATNRKAVENNKSTKEAKQSEKKTDRALPLSQPEVAIKSEPNVSEASNCAKELESSASDSTNRKVMSTDEVNGNRPMSTPSESTVIASDAKLTEPSDMDFTPIHVVAPEAMSDHVPESVATQKCVPEILSNSAVVSSFSEETGKSDSHSAVIPHEDNLSGTLAPSPESSTETPCDHVIVEPAAEYQKIPDTSPVLSPHAAHIEHLDETHPAFLNNISEEVQSSDQSAKNFLNNNALFGKSSGGDICLSSAEHLPSIPSHPSVKSESGVSNVGGRDPARDIENFEEDHLNESVRQHEPILSFEESERLTIKEHISSYGPDKPGMPYDHVESDFDDEHPEDSCHTEAEKMITTKTEAPMASESSDMVHHKPPDQPESVPVSTDLPLKSHLQEVATREEAAHHTSEILPHDSVEQFETDSMSTSRIEREICQEQPTVRASVQTSDNHTENHEEIRESVQSAKIVVDSDTSTKDLRPSDLEIPDMAAVTPADPRVSDHATVSSPKHHQTPIRSPQNEDTSQALESGG